VIRFAHHIGEGDLPIGWSSIVHPATIDSHLASHPCRSEQVLPGVVGSVGQPGVQVSDGALQPPQPGHHPGWGVAEYLGLAVGQLRAQGRQVDDAVLAHVSPAQSASIGLLGTITVDIDAELARHGPTGHRSLRQPPAAAAVT